MNRSIGLILASTTLLAGCVQQGVTKQGVAETFANKGYQGLADQLVENLSDKDLSKTSLDQLLVTGKALHDAGRWQDSSDYFDAAQAKLRWKADKIDTAQEVGRFVGTTLVNDLAAGYPGKIYEGVMLDYYQAVNQLMLGESNPALVRFNRLAERQRNAQSQFHAYAKGVQKAGEDSADDKQQKTIGKALTELQSDVAAGRSAVPSRNLAAYIRNPSGDLLDGLFRMTHSNPSLASGSLTKNRFDTVESVAPDASARSFASELERALKNDGRGTVVLIYEDGVGPAIDELRVDLPAFLVSDSVLYSGIALPKYQKGSPAGSRVGITVAGGEPKFTQRVTDVNRLAALEFDASYDKKVSKAVASAVIKTLAQSTANREIQSRDSGLGGLLASIAVASVQAATTKADTRHWYNLPNSIQMACIKANDTGRYEVLDAQGRTVATARVPAGKSAVIYVRQREAGARIEGFVQTLPANSPSRPLSAVVTTAAL